MRFFWNRVRTLLITMAGYLILRQKLEEQEMINFYATLSENPYLFVHKLLFEKLRENFHLKAFNDIRDSRSKLRT